MKKFILTFPIVFLFSSFCFTGNLEAAGCSSNKNKNLQAECSLLDDNCIKLNKDKKIKKVDA